MYDQSRATHYKAFIYANLASYDIVRNTNKNYVCDSNLKIDFLRE